MSMTEILHPVTAFNRYLQDPFVGRGDPSCSPISMSRQEQDFINTFDFSDSKAAKRNSQLVRRLCQRPGRSATPAISRTRDRSTSGYDDSDSIRLRRPQHARVSRVHAVQKASQPTVVSDSQALKHGAILFELLCSGNVYFSWGAKADPFSSFPLPLSKSVLESITAYLDCQSLTLPHDHALNRDKWQQKSYTWMRLVMSDEAAMCAFLVCTNLAIMRPKANRDHQLASSCLSRVLVLLSNHIASLRPGDGIPDTLLLTALFMMVGSSARLDWDGYWKHLRGVVGLVAQKNNMIVSNLAAMTMRMEGDGLGKMLPCSPDGSLVGCEIGFHQLFEQDLLLKDLAARWRSTTYCPEITSVLERDPLCAAFILDHTEQAHSSATLGDQGKPTRVVQLHDACLITIRIALFLIMRDSNTDRNKGPALERLVIGVRDTLMKGGRRQAWRWSHWINRTYPAVALWISLVNVSVSLLDHISLEVRDTMQMFVALGKTAAVNIGKTMYEDWSDVHNLMSTHFTWHANFRDRCKASWPYILQSQSLASTYAPSGQGIDSDSNADLDDQSYQQSPPFSSSSEVELINQATNLAP